MPDVTFSKSNSPKLQANVVLSTPRSRVTNVRAVSSAEHWHMTNKKQALRSLFSYGIQGKRNTMCMVPHVLLMLPH